MSHTKGPWRVVDHGKKEQSAQVFGGEQGDIEVAYLTPLRGVSVRSYRRIIDDANLIAAAPDLLESCKECEGLVIAWASTYALEHDLMKTIGSGLEEWHEVHRGIYEKLKAAIAKAEGR